MGRSLIGVECATYNVFAEVLNESITEVLRELNFNPANTVADLKSLRSMNWLYGRRAFNKERTSDALNPGFRKIEVRCFYGVGEVYGAAGIFNDK